MVVKTLEDGGAAMTDNPIDCPFCQDKYQTIGQQELQLKQCRATLNYIREWALSEGWWSQNMEQAHVEAVYPYKPGEG